MKYNVYSNIIFVFQLMKMFSICKNSNVGVASINLLVADVIVVKTFLFYISLAIFPFLLVKIVI